MESEEKRAERKEQREKSREQRAETGTKGEGDLVQVWQTTGLEACTLGVMFFAISWSLGGLLLHEVC